MNPFVETLGHLRAGFAYKLVAWAMRLHPPIIGEMVDTVLISAATAQGMETGTAKTEGLGPKDDSPFGTMRQNNPKGAL